MRFIIVEKEQNVPSLISRCSTFAFLPIFHFRLCSFVDLLIECKNIFCPRVQDTLALSYASTGSLFRVNSKTFYTA